LNELKELRLDAYESSQEYKENIKKQQYKSNSRREFKEGGLFLLFNSRLKLFPGKLRLRWSRSSKVVKVFPYGAIEVWSQSFEAFKVNVQRPKYYVTSNLIQEKVIYTFS